MPAPAPAPRVASVTVTFNPHPERLAEQIRALLGQVGEVILVDNGSHPSVGGQVQSQLADPRVTLVALEENHGVASGFNIGVREARSRGAQFVLLLDHDSVPTPDMVAQLMDGYRRCQERPGAPPVAAVGPRVYDVRDAREYPFVRLGWTHNRHIRCHGDREELVACDFLISSGSLIAIENFTSIGELDDALFIDSVDLEWCCRARARGFALYGVCAAQLDHRLGDHRRTVLNGITLVVHAPERIYYMTRNRFLLYRRSYVPLKWKLKDFLRVLAKFLATILLVPPRFEYARMTLRAIRDAAALRGGKFRGDEA
jgi:rhamnosyltransferase